MLLPLACSAEAFLPLECTCVSKWMGFQKEPTYPPPPVGLAPALGRNIRALRRRAEDEEKNAPWQERTADAITRFTGSMTFVSLHLVVFGFWIIANLGWIAG